MFPLHRFVTVPDGPVQSITLYKGSVYWSAGLSIYACPTAGCTDATKSTVAKDTSLIEGFAVDDLAFYWATTFNGRLRKLVRP